MTFRDRYSFSLHTIKENKSRSFLTIIISSFLSILIMGLLCLGISFGRNGNDILNKIYFSHDAIVSVNYNNPLNRIAKQEVFKEKYYDQYLETIKKHEEVISYINYTTNASNGFVYTEPSFPMAIGYQIVEGRNIVPSEAHNEVIISQTYYSEMLKNGEDYSVGTVHEDHSYMLKQLYNGRYIDVEATYNYKVVGIFALTGEQYAFDGNKRTPLDNGVVGIGDIGVAFHANEEIYISNIAFYYKSSVENVDSEAIFNKFKKLQSDLNDVLPRSVVVYTGGFELMIEEADPCYCMAYEQYELLNKYKYIFIGGGAGIGLVLLLMSVGSLANSVMISIDRSKKFIGLLKALGVNGRSLRHIIAYESITLISLGVLIGFGVLYALSYPLGLIESALVNSMYGSYVQSLGFVSSYYVPFYVLLGTIVVFVLLTLLFSRGSLRKIAKTDPIAVISEVS